MTNNKDMFSAIRHAVEQSETTEKRQFNLAFDRAGGLTRVTVEHLTPAQIRMAQHISNIDNSDFDD